MSTVVVVSPKIISGPVKLQGQRTTLQCLFNASTLHGVTVVVWKKNNIRLFNSSLYNMIQSSNPEIEDQVVSTLMINSNDVYGTYTCYCYYNSSLVISNKPVTSNQYSITLRSGTKGTTTY